MDANVQPTAEQTRYKRFGRAKGSKNYGGGISFVAQQFKREGFMWQHELVTAYVQYKVLMDAHIADKTQPEPKPHLIEFWARMMPYITQTVSEKQAYRKERRASKPQKPRITSSALERLAEAEGRKI